MSTESQAAIESFLARIPSAVRRRDAGRLIELMGRVTGEPARLSGTIVGFGTYHYRYDSGREGDSAAAAFAPRREATVVYLGDGVGSYDDELDRPQHLRVDDALDVRGTVDGRAGRDAEEGLRAHVGGSLPPSRARPVYVSRVSLAYDEATIDSSTPRSMSSRSLM